MTSAPATPTAQECAEANRIILNRYNGAFTEAISGLSADIAQAIADNRAPPIQDEAAFERELAVQWQATGKFSGLIEVCRRYVAGSKWQPIETAPKNGAAIRLAWKDDDELWTTCDGFYRDDLWIGAAAFFSHDFSNPPIVMKEHPIKPMLWQPLPAPPEQSP